MERKYEDLDEIHLDNNLANIMTELNQKIPIYNGAFQIKHDKDIIDLKGEIWFEWLPKIEIHFSGEITSDSCYWVTLIEKRELLSLSIDGSDIGHCLVLKDTISNFILLEGIVEGQAILGDNKIPVSKISFVIPNMRKFHGEKVKKVIQTEEQQKVYTGLDRLTFNNKDYKITLYKSSLFNDKFDLISNGIGYIILYSGEYYIKKGQFSPDKISNLHKCFSHFLSFLNGQRCSPLILQGIHENKIVWTDYTGYKVDVYKKVHSWPSSLSTYGLNELWEEFYTLWRNENDKDFLTTVIHWYLEANANTGFLEGSIVMIQMALELIYNWYIIEKKKLIYGKDGESISASNKLRLLLSQFSAKSGVPKAFSAMKDYLDLHKDIHDEIELFVQIRNAIIHSQEDKRKVLSKIPPQVKFEAQQLGLWYIEISLLNILKFKGIYHNRCSDKIFTSQREEKLP